MMISATLLALQYEAASPAGSMLSAFLFIGLAVFVIASIWKVYDKAGEPGWSVLIPIYGQIVMARIGGKSAWWVLALFLPGIGIIAAVVLAVGVAERFEKTALFGLGLAFLPFLFYPMLAYGDAEAQPRYA
jgi:hypothetical protein